MDVKSFQIGESSGDESTDFAAQFLNEEVNSAEEEQKIPVKYKEFAGVFSKQLAGELPPIHNKY